MTTTKIEELRERVEIERSEWQGVRWRCSKELRAEIEEVGEELLGSGWTAISVSKALGLAPFTLGRWLSCRDDHQAESGFRRVEVGSSNHGMGLSLTTPSGHRVDGLSLEQVERLLVSIR
jgi:hypothetical protein